LSKAAAAVVVAADTAVAASCSSFADPGVLNRAEWVKFVAVFFNKEVEAERLFNNVRADYQKFNSSARAAAGADGKRVAWLTQFGDTFTVNYAQYKKEYMEVRHIQ
jgi:ABC-type Fe3+-hydroxamate transport system substrate-binding protein